MSAVCKDGRTQREEGESIIQHQRSKTKLKNDEVSKGFGKEADPQISSSTKIGYEKIIVITNYFCFGLLLS